MLTTNKLWSVSMSDKSLGIFQPAPSRAEQETDSFHREVEALLNQKAPEQETSNTAGKVAIAGFSLLALVGLKGKGAGVAKAAEEAAAVKAAEQAVVKAAPEAEGVIARGMRRWRGDERAISGAEPPPVVPSATVKPTLNEAQRPPGLMMRRPVDGAEKLPNLSTEVGDDAAKSLAADTASVTKAPAAKLESTSADSLLATNPSLKGPMTDFKPESLMSSAESPSLAAPAIIGRSAADAPLLPNKPGFAIPTVFGPGDIAWSAAERTSMANVFNKHQARIVEIQASRSDGVLTPSTGLILPDGRIATARHVLDGADGSGVRPIFLVPGWSREKIPLMLESKVPSQLTDLRKKFDIDVVQLPKIPEEFAKLNPMTFSSRDLTPGQMVMFMGIPSKEGSLVLGPGHFNKLEKVRVPIRTGAEIDAIEASIHATPGTSGGTLFNKAGEGVGLVIQKHDHSSLGYSVPIANVLEAVGKKK